MIFPLGHLLTKSPINYKCMGEAVARCFVIWLIHDPLNSAHCHLKGSFFVSTAKGLDNLIFLRIIFSLSQVNAASSPAASSLLLLKTSMMSKILSDGDPMSWDEFLWYIYTIYARRSNCDPLYQILRTLLLLITHTSIFHERVIEKKQS